MAELLTPLIPSCVSALTAIFATYAAMKRASSDRQATILQGMIDRYEDSQNKLFERDAQISQLQKQVTDLQKEIHILRDKVDQYESTRVPADSSQLLEQLINTIHIPAWIHEVGANNWFINDAYCERFHVTRRDFWTPINVLRFYPAERAARYVGEDMAVIESGVHRCFEQEIPDKIMEPESEENQTRTFRVCKFPAKGGPREYLIGFAQPSDEIGSVIDFWSNK